MAGLEGERYLLRLSNLRLTLFAAASARLPPFHASSQSPVATTARLALTECRVCLDKQGQRCSGTRQPVVSSLAS